MAAFVPPPVARIARFAVQDHLVALDPVDGEFSLLTSEDLNGLALDPQLIC